MAKITFIAIISLIFGLLLFPILFYIQGKLSLLVPNLDKKKFHIHHSVYGLLLMIIGAVLFFLSYFEKGMVLFMVGVGFVVHHKISEPHWEGIENFIYWKKENKQKD